MYVIRTFVGKEEACQHHAFQNVRSPGIHNVNAMHHYKSSSIDLKCPHDSNKETLSEKFRMEHTRSFADLAHFSLMSISSIFKQNRMVRRWLCVHSMLFSCFSSCTAFQSGPPSRSTTKISIPSSFSYPSSRKQHFFVVLWDRGTWTWIHTVTIRSLHTYPCPRIESAEYICSTLSI